MRRSEMAKTDRIYTVSQLAVKPAVITFFTLCN